MINTENIKRELENRLATTLFKIEKWEQVEHLTKKDGSEFQNRKKAFKGCDYKTDYPINDTFHPVVEICGRVDGLKPEYNWKSCNSWITDTIYCYAYSDNTVNKKYNDREFVKPDTYSRPVYVLSNTEIMDEISEHIKSLKNYCVRLQNQIDNLNNYCEQVKNKLAELNSVIDSIDNENRATDNSWNHSDLYYIFKEQLTKQF